MFIKQVSILSSLSGAAPRGGPPSAVLSRLLLLLRLMALLYGDTLLHRC